MTTLLIGEDLDQYGGHYFHAKTKALLFHSSIPFEMVPKKNEYPTDLRSLVVDYFLNRNSYATIAKKLLIPHPTIQSVITKCKTTKCTMNLSGRGRNRKTTSSLHRIIQHKIKVDRRKSAATAKIEIKRARRVYSWKYCWKLALWN